MLRGPADWGGGSKKSGMWYFSNTPLHQCTKLVHDDAVQHGRLVKWVLTNLALKLCTKLGRDGAVQHWQFGYAPNWGAMVRCNMARRARGLGGGVGENVLF